MEKAAQEIEAIADRVQQLGGPSLDSFLVKHQFLSGLPDEYESARQILESQDAKMGEIITRLMEIELRMKSMQENGALPNFGEAAN
jgi:DNA-binding ferritin-like protein